MQSWLKDNLFVTGVYPSPMRTGGHTHAVFKGKRNKEYAWFGILASTPLLSSSPSKVAKKLWDAVQHGDAELTIGLPSKLALVVQVLLPNLTAEAMRLIGRVLTEETHYNEINENTTDAAIAGENLTGVVPFILNRLTPKDLCP